MLAQPLDLGIFTTTVVSFLVMLRKVLPCALLDAGVVATTHVNELMAAFSRMRVPRAVTIPLAVMMRYLPAIREDWQHLRDAGCAGSRLARPVSYGTRPSRRNASTYP